MTEPRIIYIDESTIVLDKPSGLMVHADGKSEASTLTDWLLEKYPEVRGVGDPRILPNGEELDRAGVVHRLDRDTSGVMVIARTPRAFSALKKQFLNRDVQKVYRAFVYGRLKENRGLIDKPIGRGKGSGSRRSVKNAHGTMREAQTLFRTIARTGEQAAAPASYIEAFPKTGRTHQIRVHMLSVQHPIVCDKLYAPSKPCILGFERLALHALSLSFRHPESKQEVKFEAPLPPDFLEAEQKLNEPA